eukprot:3855059-Rhodomonas_salina.1
MIAVLAQPFLQVAEQGMCKRSSLCSPASTVALSRPHLLTPLTDRRSHFSKSYIPPHPHPTPTVRPFQPIALAPSLCLPLRSLQSLFLPP